MTVRYSKLFTVTGAISNEPVTILVERVEAEGLQWVSIESLDGEYHSTKDFGKASNSNRVINDMKEIDKKSYVFLPLVLPDTRQLVEALNEALVASSGA